MNRRVAVGRLLKLVVVVAFVALPAVVISACGSGSDEREGGEMTILGTSFPDYLDPALSFTVDGWEVLSQVYPGLLSYPHKSGQAGAKPVPALAEDMPEISANGKTYTFQLRDNINFSDGTPVKASDFKHSIERILAQDSQGASFYTGIVGAEDFLETKKGGIRGIKTDDDTGEIEIDLTESRGSFLFELAIPFAGIVPGDTPNRNMTANPAPGAGFYMIEDVRRPRSYTVVKNDKFSPGLEGTDVDAGKLDQFNVKIEPSASNQVTQVAQNRADFLIENPPADRLPEVRNKYSDRFRLFPTNSTFYFFLNTEAPPFDKLKVRQAANHAIEPEAINRIQGGVLAPAHTVLPPGVPGYKESEPLYPYDLNKAKQLVREADAVGADVTVWGNPEDPTKPTVEYYADQLNKIGLDAKVRIISGETYFTAIGDRATKAQTGWYNWFQDYPHPADFIQVLFDPSNVKATGNTNQSFNAGDKQLARKINALAAEPELTDEAIDGWAGLDREIQEQALGAFYGNREQSTFFSTRMNFADCKGDDHPVWTHDWAQFCLK